MRKLEIVPELLTKGAQLLGQESPAQGEGKRYLYALAFGLQGEIFHPEAEGAGDTQRGSQPAALREGKRREAGYDRALRHSAAGGDAGLF